MEERAAPEADFEGWFTSAWPSLVRALTAWSGEPTEAADAAAEACARAYGQWERVGTMASPTGWAFRVGQTCLRRRFRRRRRESDGAADHVVAGDGADEVGAHDEVVRLLQALPPRQREAVVLRYLLDLTQDEVARHMGIATGSAAATLNSARENLRRTAGPPLEVDHGT